MPTSPEEVDTGAVVAEATVDVAAELSEKLFSDDNDSPPPLFEIEDSGGEKLFESTSEEQDDGAFFKDKSADDIVRPRTVRPGAKETFRSPQATFNYNPGHVGAAGAKKRAKNTASWKQRLLSVLEHIKPPKRLGTTPTKNTSVLSFSHGTKLDHIKRCFQVFKEDADGEKFTPVAFKNLLLSLTATTQPFKIVSSLSALRELDGSERVLLAGSDVVAASFNPDDEAPNGYFAQPNRFSDGTALVPSGDPMRMWIDAKVLNGLKSTGGQVYIFMDQILSWARAQKTTMILFTGGLELDDRSTPIDIWWFEEGVLRKFVQVSTVSHRDERYIEELSALIGGYISENRAYAPVIYTALDRRRELSEDIKAYYLDEDFFFFNPTPGRIKYGYVRVVQGDLFIPTVVFISALIIATLVILTDKARFALKAGEFQEEVSNIKEVYSKGDGALAALQAQRDFLQKNSAQIQANDNLKNVLIALAEAQGVSVVSITSSIYIKTEPPADGSKPPPPKPDFTLTFSVLSDPTKSAVEQSAPIIQKIVESTGANVALIRQTTRSETIQGTDKNHEIRIFEVEGRFPDHG